MRCWKRTSRQQRKGNPTMDEPPKSRQQRIEAIFAAALLLNDPAEREAYLAGACGDDAELRAEVELALNGAERAGGFLGDVSLAKQITSDMPMPPAGAGGGPQSPTV